MTSNVHTGDTDRIKTLIATRGRPLTVPAIATALRLDEVKVRSLVNICVSRTGGLVRAGREGRRNLYALPGMLERKVDPAAVPRRYEHRFVELYRDPFEALKLAMVGPR